MPTEPLRLSHHGRPRLLTVATATAGVPIRTPGHSLGEEWEKLAACVATGGGELMEASWEMSRSACSL